jgi:hypothetical protein
VFRILPVAEPFAKAEPVDLADPDTKPVGHTDTRSA